MIRILHVVTYMGRGGLETVLMNYYRNIDRSKVQFDFLTHRDFRADYDDEIETLGGKIYRLPRLVPWSPSYKKALNSFFGEHPEYKIVHVHQDCLSSVILRAAKSHDVPVRIAHSHNNNQDKNLKYLIKLFYRRSIPKYATELFACSKEAGEWMFRGAPYTVLNNAINADIYKYIPDISRQKRRLLSIPDDVFVVGHIGRFAPQKNHDFLIDIFFEIQKQRADSRLLLVGDGELRSNAEAKVNKLGISEKVIFTGIRNDIPELLQAMDVFVMPSKYEGLGLAAIEAQAGGLHCFVSDDVSKECNVTNLVSYSSLENDAKHWAEMILSCADKERRDTYDLIKNSGYDIVSNAMWLQNHYIELWESN